MVSGKLMGNDLVFGTSTVHTYILYICGFSKMYSFEI